MCVAPLLSWTGDSGNKVDGNSHGTQYLLHLGPHCCSLPLTPMGQSGATKFHLSLMEEDWVREHGEKLDICMFVRTEGMHPQVQSQSHCKPFLIIFERSRWSGQVPRKKKKENASPVFESSKEDPRNRRPLSFTSTSGKLMEQTLLETISRHSGSTVCLERCLGVISVDLWGGNNSSLNWQTSIMKWLTWWVRRYPWKLFMLPLASLLHRRAPIMSLLTNWWGPGGHHADQEPAM